MVKSDDAAIPEYLWEDHLTEDNDRVWTPRDWVGLPRAMDLLRDRMLCGWLEEEGDRFVLFVAEERAPSTAGHGSRCHRGKG